MKGKGDASREEMHASEAVALLEELGRTLLAPEREREIRARLRNVKVTGLSGVDRHNVIGHRVRDLTEEIAFLDQKVADHESGAVIETGIPGAVIPLRMAPDVEARTRWRLRCCECERDLWVEACSEYDVQAEAEEARRLEILRRPHAVAAR
jgi:hypothetical protein